MPVLLLHGDNTLEIDEAARAVRQPFQPASTLILDGTTTSLATLAEASMTMGLFDPERLVVVDNLHDRLKGRKNAGETEEIGKVLASVPPSTTLLLVCKDMPANHALVGLARQAGATVRAFQNPRDKDLPRWIEQRARRHGASIDPDATSLLAELVGSNPLLLESELEKLSTYAGTDGRITPHVVESLVGSVPRDTIFDLVDAIAGGEPSRALSLLHAQLDSASTAPIGFALQLIPLLARQVRILLRIRLGQEAGRNRQQIIGDARVPPYYANRYFKQAGRLSRDRLVAAFDQLASLEYALKNGEADAATGLDLLVVDLCG